MDKFWRSVEMLRAADHAAVELVEVGGPASEAVLLGAHSEAYLCRIRAGALSPAELVRLGLPAGEALLTRSRLEVAGTLAALEAVIADGGLACNLAGGTHHAFADRGLGYCVLNDVAIAIRAHHAAWPEARIAVVDTDAHQGNGTHGIFADDPRVFTYSIHVGKNYPAQKTPGRLDVELPRFVHGADYLEQLEATLGPALEEFSPDLVFWIAGADVHEDDRFGQMRLTDADIAARDNHVLDLLTARPLPAVVLYGGGYNQDRVHTARIHADTVLRVAARATGAVDPRRCPLCGRANRCGEAAGGGGGRCWCFDVKVPAELLARVPTHARGKVCVCRGCVEAHLRGTRADASLLG
ncbi:MAG: cysteine-rich CWC family protein [Verrucomicrobiota bacterium]